MGEAMITSYTHDDGRPCLLSADGVTWRYWRKPYNMVGGLICFRAHPAPEDRVHNPDKEQERLEEGLRSAARGDRGDRGDFGMPGLGAIKGLGVSVRDLAPGMFDGDGITHPPDHHIHSSVGTHDMPGVFDFLRSHGMAAWDRSSSKPVHQYVLDLLNEPETDLARRIMEVHLPEAVDHFLGRNAEYGDDDDFDLGVSGQYVDISRKVQKLKRRWWDNEDVPEDAESDKVIVMELIGHLLMSLDYLAQEDGDES
jgi:hypothetical protein